jgi:putative Holliday junction resolvase
MSKIAALDFGGKRVGVAIADLASRLPRPLKTLMNGPHLFDELSSLISEEEITLIVIGLPRNLSGDDTYQTRLTRQFAQRLRKHGFPVVLQDEAGTSDLARSELEARRKPYARSDIDALAACYILEDYLKE